MELTATILLHVSGVTSQKLVRLPKGVPESWIVAALWGPLAPLRARLGLVERPLEADLLVVLGTLTLPFLVAASQIVLGDAGEAGFLGSPHGATVAVLVTMGAAALVGMAWDA